MAGKHVGSAAYVTALTHPAVYPGSKENKAFAEGAQGDPAANPHASGTVDHAAYAAGAASSTYAEVAPGGVRSTEAVYSSPAQTGAEVDGADNWNDLNTSLGYDGAQSRNGGIGFADVVFPASAVSSALLDLPFGAVTVGAPELLVKAQDIATGVTFSASSPNYPSAMTKTTAGATPFTPTASSTEEGIDVTAIINELIASYGAGTRRLNIVVMDNELAGFALIDHAFAGAVLTITP